MTSLGSLSWRVTYGAPADQADSSVMTSLADLTREHSVLDREDVDHLHRLGAEWAFLADLCFADLLLHVRTGDGRWLIVDQVRPATNQTMYVTDYVGSYAESGDADIIERAATTGVRAKGEIELTDDPDATTARMTAIPVRRNGNVIAVMSKQWKVRTGRAVGELERNYSMIFEEFVRMIEEGTFPFAGRVADSSAAPRIGDGVMALDGAGTVTYVSPNANSALHRVGIQANPIGMRLAELGFHDGPVRQAFERREPIVEEFEQGADVTLLCRCVPIVGISTDGATEASGGMLLVRDVTELRKRDRLLLSKDATIREIHHRVKNNLQTISSLLRLQARRLTNAEAKAAVSESVRRIRTIALVHESLSREPGEDIAFIEIVRPLLRLAEEGLQSPDRPVRFTVKGDGGRIPAKTATPSSVVLTELLQNAIDHGFPEGSGGGEVVVLLSPHQGRLNIRVVDNGRGVDPGFDLDSVTGLGLSIVRTLVTTELNGTIEIRSASPADLDVVSLGDGSTRQHGTVIELCVPTDD